MFQSGVAFGERVYLAHPHGTTATVDVPVLLPGGGPSTRDRAVSAIPAGRGDTAGPGRRTRRSVDTGRSKTNRRRNRTADTGPAISTRLILPGRPDPILTAARTALGVTAGPLPVDVDRSLSRCVTTGEARWASEVLQISDWRRAVTTLPAGPDLAAALHHRPDGLNTRPGLRPWASDGVHWAAAIVDGMTARARLIASLQAAQYADTAALAKDYPGLTDMLGMELSMALHLTGAAADTLIRTATALTDRLPSTLAALAVGTVTDTVARTMVRATTTSRPAVAQAVDADVTPDTVAKGWNPEQVRRRAHRQVIAHDPDGAADRHHQARRDRHMARWMLSDGMAALKLTAPAQDIALIWEAATALADTADSPDDDRTLGARRVDAITDLAHHVLNDDTLAAHLTGGAPLATRQGRRPHVQVTIPYDVLLGANHPCHLDGHGAITADQARLIAADGTLTRLVTDPLSGTLLDYGRTRYDPPDTLRQFVITREQTCSFVGCTHPAGRGQIDHITRYHPGQATGGTTNADNLAAPDQHHHRAKDGGGWTHTRLPDGTHQWTSPLGRVGHRPPTPLWEPPTPRISDERPETPAPQQQPAPTSDTERRPTAAPPPAPAPAPAPASAVCPATTPTAEQPTSRPNQHDETDRAAADSANNPERVNPDSTDLDNDEYLDFLIAGYDPDRDNLDPHDRFPRSTKESPERPPAPPAATDPADDPPPF